MYELFPVHVLGHYRKSTYAFSIAERTFMKLPAGTGSGSEKHFTRIMSLLRSCEVIYPL